MLNGFSSAPRPGGYLACRSEAFNRLGEVWFRDAVRRVQRAANVVLGLHRGHQRTIAQQVQHPFEVVGEHMQAHFRAHPVVRPGEEMGGTHSRFQRAKWMLHRLAADAHHLWSLVQAGLHSAKHRLMFPATHPPLCARCALIFQRTTLVMRTPVTVQLQAFLNRRKTPDQAFSGWAAVLVLGRIVDEIIAAEVTRCGSGQGLGLGYEGGDVSLVAGENSSLLK